MRLFTGGEREVLEPRRLGTIASARGRPVAEIDLDVSPVELEDRFAAEDAAALTAG